MSFFTMVMQGLHFQDTETIPGLLCWPFFIIDCETEKIMVLLSIVNAVKGTNPGKFNHFWFDES